MLFPIAVAARRLFIQAVPLIAAVAILVGCETPPETIIVEKPPAPATLQRPDPQLITARETIARLQEEITRLKQYSTVQRGENLELQLQLLEKQSAIALLLQAHNQAIQEVVRAKARLGSRHSKAETVASLAELKLSLKNAGSKEAGEQLRIPLRTRQYLTMAEAELEKSNFEGASYLMDQARRSLAWMKPGTGIANQDSAFPVALKMETKGPANVRSGPSRKQQVLFQLNDGSEVSALDRNGLWVQIKTADEKTGWVHFSLLKTN